MEEFCSAVNNILLKSEEIAVKVFAFADGVIIFSLGIYGKEPLELQRSGREPKALEYIQQKLIWFSLVENVNYDC